MSKVQHRVILPAEQDGWEIWSHQEGVATLVEVVDSWHAIEPAATMEHRFALSSRHIMALPFTVPSDEADMVRNAAKLELEKTVSMHEESEAWGCALVEKGSQYSFATAVCLLEDSFELPDALHQSLFDVAASYYQPASKEDCIALWQEQSQWCLVFYRNRIPFFVEPIEAPSYLPASMAVYQAQLSYRGVEFAPQEVLLWSDYDACAPLELQLLEQQLPLKKEPKPDPALPVMALQMRPRAVVEWHHKLKRKEKLRTLSLLVLCVYVAMLLTGWFVLQSKNKEIQQLDQTIRQHSPQWEINQQHFSDWEALESVVTEQWPLALCKECMLCLPNSLNIRFTLVNIEDGTIQLRGEAQSTALLNTFRTNLRKSDVLAEYQWTMPPEKKSVKTKQWEFNYTAKPKVYAQE